MAFSPSMCCSTGISVIFLARAMFTPVRLGGKLAVFKLPYLLPLLIILARLTSSPCFICTPINRVPPTPPDSGTCLWLGPACSFEEDLCKLAISSAWSLLKLELSPAGWFLCSSHPACVESCPGCGLQCGIGTTDLSGTSACRFWLQVPKNENISLGINTRVLMNLYLYVLIFPLPESISHMVAFDLLYICCYWCGETGKGFVF